MKQVVLRSRPAGNPRAEDFALETVDAPTAGAGQLLLETRATRGFLRETVEIVQGRVNEHAPTPGGARQIADRIVDTVDERIGQLPHVPEPTVRAFSLLLGQPRFT